MGRWYRGNTHAHSTVSDGDVPPEEAARWFREHGYDFVCLTDHFRSPEPGLASSLSDERFLVIPGQEMSARVNGTPLHVNALGIEETIPEPDGTDVAAVLKEMTVLARRRTPVITINHPNFCAAFTADEMLDIEGPFLLEVWNGHPQVYNFGWPGRPSVESMWDRLLSAGKRVYGVACDDSHHYREEVRRHPHSSAPPGRGWVNVWAEALTVESILGALLRGDFYASTGVELERIEIETGRYAITGAASGAPYRFLFVGPGGEVLRDETGDSAAFDLEGREGYVRAAVFGANGIAAWTRPAFLEDRGA